MILGKHSLAVVALAVGLAVPPVIPPPSPSPPPPIGAGSGYTRRQRDIPLRFPVYISVDLFGPSIAIKTADVSVVRGRGDVPLRRSISVNPVGSSIGVETGHMSVGISRMLALGPAIAAVEVFDGAVSIKLRVSGDRAVIPVIAKGRAISVSLAAASKTPRVVTIKTGGVAVTANRTVFVVDAAVEFSHGTATAAVDRLLQISQANAEILADQASISVHRQTLVSSQSLDAAPRSLDVVRYLTVTVDHADLSLATSSVFVIESGHVDDASLFQRRFPRPRKASRLDRGFPSRNDMAGAVRLMRKTDKALFDLINPTDGDV